MFLDAFGDGHIHIEYKNIKYLGVVSSPKCTNVINTFIISRRGDFRMKIKIEDLKNLR